MLESMELKVNKLAIKIGSFNLDCENLVFEDGGKYLIFAPNGSGKSVLLKGIVALIKTTVRDIDLDGKKVQDYDLSKVTATYLDEQFLVPFYKPLEYFEFLGKIKSVPTDKVNAIVKDFSDLFGHSWPKKYIRELSTGMRKKVGLAGSLIGTPSVILWDEPFENVDEQAVINLKKFIEKDKRLIVYTSPSTDELPKSKIITIENGLVKCF